MSRFRYTRTLTALLSLSSLIAAHTVTAAETPYWYDVEVALIGYQDSQKIEHETWPEVIVNDAPITNTPITEAPITEEESPQEESPWAWIDWWNDKNADSNPQDSGPYNVQNIKVTETSELAKPFSDQGLAFENKMARLNRAKGMSIVWSQKWRQPIQAKKQATNSDNLIEINFKAPLNLTDTINKGKALDEVEISGHIYLYRSRYLHLVSELQVQHWRTLSNNNSLGKDFASPHSGQTLGQNIIPSSSSSPLTAIDTIPLRAAHVNHSRRMRSNELHYIDHPMLGILVRVTPVNYEVELPKPIKSTEEAKAL